MIVPKLLSKYQSYYSTKKLWRKVESTANKIKESSIFKVFTLYYTLEFVRLTKVQKIVVYGALGYFIFPFDFIPDFIPWIGYIDDIALIIYALNYCGSKIDSSSKEKAIHSMRRWFSISDETKLIQSI